MDYKDKLKLAKEALDSGSYDKETIEYIFPELAESEDEKIRKELIEFFSKGAEYDSSTNGIKDRNIIAWLEKQGEQKPAWSEEDEEHYKACLQYFDEVNPDMVFYKDYLWLKSLKPQNKWKPSEEQMRALHDLNLTGNISYAGQGQVLIGLYNDLKKLKGE